MLVYRSIITSTNVPDESKVVEPFSRADVLYNKSVDKLAIKFEDNKDKGCLKSQILVH